MENRSMDTGDIGVFAGEAADWDTARLTAEINRLKSERKAVILAHNYQRGEIQDIAEFTGDSLGLSIEAAKTDAETIVFCGVHFMAESAAILSPEKTVLLPRLEAGCPMADMVTVEKLRAKRAELGKEIPVICYVNSSAAVKAESDICCTSANAVKVADSLAGETDTALGIPDQNLATYMDRHSKIKVIPWKGFCPTHQLLTPEQVLRMKKEHPDALFIAHPECREEVVALADKVASTSGMFDFAEKSPAREFLIGTETGILHGLRKRSPHKVFHAVWEEMICPNMKVTTLEDVYYALRDMRHVVSVEEPVRSAAKRTLDRMLAIPRD